MGWPLWRRILFGCHPLFHGTVDDEEKQEDKEEEEKQNQQKVQKEERKDELQLNHGILNNPAMWRLTLQSFGMETMPIPIPSFDTNRTTLDLNTKGKGIAPTECTLRDISYEEFSRGRNRHRWDRDVWDWDSVYEKGDCSYSFCALCSKVIPDDEQKLESNLCNHTYCGGCLISYVGEKMQEDISKVKCPGSNCQKEFRPGDFKAFVPEEVFDRWMSANLEAKALTFQSLILCPFKNCLAFFVDNGRGYVIRACPKCWRIFCVRCRIPYKYHMGIDCDFIQMLMLTEFI